MVIRTYVWTVADKNVRKWIKVNNFLKVVSFEDSCVKNLFERLFARVYYALLISLKILTKKDKIATWVEP